MARGLAPRGRAGRGRGRGRGHGRGRRRPPSIASSTSDESSEEEVDDDDEDAAPIVVPDLSGLRTRANASVMCAACCALAATCFLTMPRQPFLFGTIGLPMLAIVCADQRRRDLARLRRRRRERRRRWSEYAAAKWRLPRRGNVKFEDYLPLVRPDPAVAYDDDYIVRLKELFRRDFRLSFEAYSIIMDTIRSDLVCRTPLKLRKGEGPLLHFRCSDEVALIALWFLATGDTYRCVASIFRRNCSEAIVMRCVRTFTSVLVAKLRQKYVTRHFLNSEAKRRKAARAFQCWSGFEHCCFVIDGSHIAVSPPKEGHDDYFNRKGWYSTVLSGTVDAVGRFIHIYVGLPGMGSDVQALEES